MLQRWNNSVAGICLMILAVLLLSCMSLLAKFIGPDYHPLQVTFMRNLVAGAVILPFVFKFGGKSALRTQRPMGHFLRALAGVVGNACYFFAYQHLPLADVMVLSQSVPLCVTIFAIPFLKEQVGWRRLSAVFIGFIGVIVALDPSGQVSPVSLIALLGPVLWSVTILMVRDLGRTENPYTIAFFYMLIGTLLSGFMQPFVWLAPSIDIMFLFFLLGVAGAFGQMLMTYALKVAEASVVSPFNYTAIIWGLCFDFFFWGLIPAWTTLLGAIIICSSGFYIFRRELLDKNK